MRAIIQRVTHASVKVDGEITGAIEQGFLVLLGITHNDTQEDIDWLVKKITNMRIFSDDQGKMNRSLLDVQGKILLVSQFTLFASTKKGNRPSFIQSAPPDVAIPLYENFIESLNQQTPFPTETGIFGADMKVELLNDGPVTIHLDTQNKE